MLLVLSGRLTDVNQLISSSVTDVRKASDHLSQQRAFLGAQINKAELQKDALDQRIIATSEKISDIDTADMAALVNKTSKLTIKQRCCSTSLRQNRPKYSF